MTESSVFIAIPYTRPHYGGFMKCLMKGVFELGRDVEIKDKYGLAVDQARNYLSESFLQCSTAEFCLMVDNDAEFHAGAMRRLVEHNLPMVCGCMYTRSLPPRITVGQYIGRNGKGKDMYRWGGTMKEVLRFTREQKYRVNGEECRVGDLTAAQLGELENGVMFEEARLLERDGCGMHFTLIRRDVLEAVRRPWFLMLGDTGAGEDFYFSRKVKEAGFPIYVDLSIHTGHYVGEEYSFGLRELLIMTRYLREEDIVDEVGAWEVG